MNVEITSNEEERKVQEDIGRPCEKVEYSCHFEYKKTLISTAKLLSSMARLFHFLRTVQTTNSLLHNV